MRRVDVPPPLLASHSTEDELTLPDEQAHYLRDVLRLDEGATVELFDGTGTVARAQLLEVGENVRLRLLKHKESERGESPIQTVLFQAIPKGKRWKWILEKATELGVDRVIPLETKRTVVKIPDDRLERRMDRWDKIAASATRQCKRTVTPEISVPMSAAQAFESPSRDIDLVAHPGDTVGTPQQVLDDLSEPIQCVGIWIGPEGGFTDGEVQTLLDRGARRVALGPRILRADTAGITALTLIQAACGDLGSYHAQSGHP